MPTIRYTPNASHPPMPDITWDRGVACWGDSGIPVNWSALEEAGMIEIIADPPPSTSGPHMTRTQNYREAERLLADTAARWGSSDADRVIAAAQVHATLAACPFEPHPVSSQEKPR